MDTDVFDLQERKNVRQSFNVVSFNLSSLHCHIFVFRHYKWQSFEIGISYSQSTKHEIIMVVMYLMMICIIVVMMLLDDGGVGNTNNSGDDIGDGGDGDPDDDDDDDDDKHHKF